MSGKQIDGLLRRVLLKPLSHLSDQELLMRFVGCDDQEAFAAIVARHGPGVYGLCRRIVRADHLAEEALQATFLVLCRKANAIQRRESLVGWLFAVAYRVARQARLSETARYRRERRVASNRAENVELDDGWREWLSVLDEELSRMPERHRSVLVSCYLEGLTQDEAACYLGVSTSTLRRRLEQGRDLLRLRMARRGMVLGTALLATCLAASGTKAQFPATEKVMMIVKASCRGDSIPTSVALLAQAGVRQSLIIQSCLCFTVIVSLIGAGVAWKTTRGDSSVVGAARSAPLNHPLQGNPGPSKLEATTTNPAADGRGSAPSNSGKVVQVAFQPNRISLRVLTDAVLCVRFSPDGKRLAGAGYQKKVRLWDMDKLELERTFESTQDNLYSLAFAPDGKSLAAGSRGGVIYVWDLTTGELLHAIRGHQGILFSLAYAPDGKTIAAASTLEPSPPGDRYTTTVKLWNASSGQLTQVVTSREGSVRSVAFSPDGKLLGLAAMPMGVEKVFRGVELWDTATRQVIRRFEHPQGFPLGFAFSPDGQSIVSGGGYPVPVGSGSRGIGEIYLWDAASGNLRWSLTAKDSSYVRSVAFAPDGQSVVGASESHHKQRPAPGGGFWLTMTSEVRCIDAATGKLAWYVENDPGDINSVAMAPDGKSVIYSDRRHLKRLEAANGNVQQVLFTATETLVNDALKPLSR